jgi:tetratricopeptide (TPR) repeat protein
LTTQSKAIAAENSGFATPAASPASPWIYRPWLDLLVGCGAWSAPLLAIAAWLTPSHTHGWAVGFYLLAIIFNYPHFMATIYRAYHTREQFEKYKFFTLHLTLLMVLTGIVLHASYRLVPWVFTLYICWSPWHYTGQNYGLMMMFARRAGATITPAERRWLHAAFVASYVMLLASFMTGGSNDPLVLSLGLPQKLTLPARLVLGITFAAFAFAAFRPWIRRHGARAMAAPLTLVITQFLWFVLPTLLELHSAYQVPQTRYSSGILAVLHSAQYLWITSYYQRREARAAGQSTWRMAGYFVTLIAGGIALFIPGPWLVSYIFHYDFTTSFLIFTALVNIHHFLLDGALWKLRDTRIASLLIDPSTKADSAKSESASPSAAATGSAAKPSAKPAATHAAANPAAAKPSRARRLLASPAFQIALVALLFLWGGMDQLHFALGTDESNLPALLRASQMNPYDAMLEARIASAATKAGNKDQAVAALTRAVAINPHNAGLQHACARAMIEDGRYADAYEHYRKMLEIFPRDPDALINYGLLAAKLGHPEVAIDSWEKAVDIAPNRPNAQLYLAEALDRKNEPAAAARHWNLFLELAAKHTDDPVVTSAQVNVATLQLADDEARVNRKEAALAGYLSAIALAERDNNIQLESLALAHLGDYQEKIGDPAGAAHSFQRGLALDAQLTDSRSEAFDWFNYGQFLRRRGVPLELAYACYLQAEILLAGKGGENLETVETARHEVEILLGKKAVAAQQNLPELLNRAANLPANSF